jgi:hypothetical protein
MSKVLCIAGMHRSGTSLVTSWLQRCGLQIDDGQLLAANTGNPTGHFEDIEFNIVSLCDVVTPEAQYRKMWPRR